MLGFVLDVLFVLFIVRSIWKLVQGFMEGYTGSPSAPRRDSVDRAPTRGVQMARDPVCGTYVVPDRALAVSDGSRTLFFCSAGCRDKYRAKSA